MKLSLPNCLMLLLVFSFGWQTGCDSPVAKTQDVEQKKTEMSKDDHSSNADVDSDEVFQVISEAVDPLKHIDPNKPENNRQLFDGKTIDGWETIEFGGEGDVEVVDGEIRMYAGDPLTGMCVTEDVELPTANYEFALEATKLEGTDFFCAVTFPVNDTFCSLIVGGWGGNLVGLSNLDDQNASENETKLMRKFEKDRWYAIRIQVLPDRITVWIDDEKLIDQSIEGVKVSVRGDITTTTPLGIFNFLTSSSFRNIKLRKLE